MENKFLDGGYIAHRGLHNAEFPENSLGAFENAIKHGFAFEFDVRLTKDGVLGVFHDDNLSRLCGIDRDFDEIYAKEFKNYKILGFAYYIPSLKEVLELTNGKVPLLIEAKGIGNSKQMAQALYDELQGYTGEFAIQSSNPFILKHLYPLMPKVPLVYLCSKTWEGDKSVSWITRKILYSLMLYKSSHATYISCQHDEVNKKVLKKANGNLLLWTIRNQDQATAYLGNCKGIIFENFIPKK